MLSWATRAANYVAVGIAAMFAFGAVGMVSGLFVGPRSEGAYATTAIVAMAAGAAVGALAGLIIYAVGLLVWSYRRRRTSPPAGRARPSGTSTG